MLLPQQYAKEDEGGISMDEKSEKCSNDECCYAEYCAGSAKFKPGVGNIRPLAAIAARNVSPPYGAVSTASMLETNPADILEVIHYQQRSVGLKPCFSF